MPDDRGSPDLAHGVPPVAVSSTSTRVNLTGSWKYIRPVYQDKVAPCNQGCPVGIDIEGYMNLLREDRIEDAIGLLLRENALPAVTGRVCYHPCENACNRAWLDDAVSIHGVERMLGDLAIEQRILPEPETPRPETVGIVGSGPAGLSCAYHLARLGYTVTVYEAEAEPGGILRYGIPEYRLPKDVLAHEVNRIRALGVDFRCGVQVGRDLPLNVLESHDAVFVATGARRGRALGIEGEDLPGVRAGLDFLREVNRGGRPALGHRVVVVGGGNTAMDCARTALRLGAEVLVLYRRGREGMPAHDEEVEDALREGVRFEFLAAPVRVESTERVPDREPLEAIEATFDRFEGEPPAPHVAGLTCTRMRLEEPDRSGRPRPVPVEGSEFFVAADLVLTALGEDPDFDFLPEDVERASGVVRVNALNATGHGALFAGGDITDEPHTVAFALGSGKRAAVGIDRYLRFRAGEIGDGADLSELRQGPKGNISVTRWVGGDPVRRTDPVNRVVTFQETNPAHFAPVARAADRHLPPGERRLGFREANLGLEREQALAEARRCFNCGVCNECELCLVFCPDLAISRSAGGGYEIAYDYCKGCGVCATECPRGAITMTREGL